MDLSLNWPQKFQGSGLRLVKYDVFSPPRLRRKNGLKALLLMSVGPVNVGMDKPTKPW